MRRKVYIIDGLDCANCAAKIERKINQLEEVEEATLTFATKQLRVTAKDPDALLPQMLEIARSVEGTAAITPWGDGREIEKEKNEGKPEFKEEKSIYANRQTEIKVNQDYLDKLGMSVVDETEKEVAADKTLKQDEDDEELKQLEAEIRVNLDADYFQWKEGKDGKDKPDKQESKTKGKSEGIQKAFKNLIGGHQHDDSGM